MLLKLFCFELHQTCTIIAAFTAAKRDVVIAAKRYAVIIAATAAQRDVITAIAAPAPCHHCKALLRHHRCQALLST
jgi:hypothetical protein